MLKVLSSLKIESFSRFTVKYFSFLWISSNIDDKNSGFLKMSKIKGTIKENKNEIKSRNMFQI